MRSIKENLEKINPVRERSPQGDRSFEIVKAFSNGVKPFYMLILSLISGGILFGLGRLSSEIPGKTPISVKYEVANVISSSQTGEKVEEKVTDQSVLSENKTTEKKQVIVVPVPETSGEVIGSKSGKKYYYPWCGTVKRIKPENRVYFASIELARQAGFTPGGNCKGLK
ncbi:MAG: hypothetical protein WAX44_03685 [Minisyncoccia bacterium]